MKVISYSIFIFLLLTFGCKKDIQYSEDPKKTRLSPEKRLVGTWQLKTYTFNDNDIVPQLNSLNTKEDILQTIINYRKGDISYEMELATANTVSNECYFDKLYIHFQTGCCTKPNATLVQWFVKPFHNDTLKDQKTLWHITKLFKDNLNVILQTDTGTFKICFIKQKK